MSVRTSREAPVTRACVTVNLPSSITQDEAISACDRDFEELKTAGDYSYFIYSLERGITSDHLHIQAFLVLDTARPNRARGLRLHGNNGFIALIHSHWPGAHVEKARGTTKQASDYCEKSTDPTFIAGPWKHGELVSQGQRSSLLEVKAAIDQRMTDKELWNSEDYFPSMVRYNKAFAIYRNIQITPRSKQTELIYHIGPPGYGKTHFVLDAYPDAFWVSAPNRGQSLWWDGYQQQSTVVMDEFRGFWFPTRHYSPLRTWLRTPYKPKVCPRCNLLPIGSSSCLTFTPITCTGSPWTDPLTTDDLQKSTSGLDLRSTESLDEPTPDQPGITTDQATNMVYSLTKLWTQE